MYKVFYVLICVYLTCSALSLEAADMLGRGFDSKKEEIRESPITDLELVYGPSSGSVDFQLVFHSRQETNSVIAKGGVSIGTPILGAELSGQLRLLDKESENFFSADFRQEYKQRVEIKNYQKNDELTNEKMSSNNVKFIRKYGDKILWSLDKGGKLFITLMACHKSKLNEKSVHIEAKLKLLFAQVSAGEYNDEDRQFADSFDFAICIFQGGGDKTALQTLREQCGIKNWGNFNDFANILKKVFEYAQKKYPYQLDENPYISEKDYIQYSDGRIMRIFS